MNRHRFLNLHQTLQMTDKNEPASGERSRVSSSSPSTSSTDGKNNVSRRTFLKNTSATAISLPLISSSLLYGQSPSNKPNYAFIGTGGRATAHLNKMKGQNCICYCDVDTKRQKKAAKFWPKAKSFQDYRRMFDEMHKEIDAVFITTPDHHHFPAAMMAMQRDIHVYCEKPLTWSSWEARKLKEVAEEKQLATQMGNQGHAKYGWRKVVGWIRQGAIGEIKEVHNWTNRPIWPQGVKQPTKADDIPDHLDWNVWLGPAQKIPYAHRRYHPFKWRGWYDFGAGALGDMACHTMDGLFWALEPGHPDSVELIDVEKHMPESFPTKSTVKWEFPKTDKRPGFTAYWYDGKPKFRNKPPRPEGVDKKKWKHANTGNLFVGTKGTIRVFGSYGNRPKIVESELAKEVGKPDSKFTPDTSPGHHREFDLAVRGEKPWNFPKSNFSYAGPMTETILLGVVAQRVGEVGKTLKYDGKNMQFTNDDKATALLKRDYREGWKVV